MVDSRKLELYPHPLPQVKCTLITEGKMSVTSTTLPSCTSLLWEVSSASMFLPSAATPMEHRSYLAGPWTLPPYRYPPHRLLMAYNREAALSGLGSGCDTPGQYLTVASLALAVVISTARYLCTATNSCTSFIRLSS